MAEFDPRKHCGAQRINQPPGVLCTRPKGWGTDHPGAGHCKRHFGNTENGKSAAAKEVAAEAIVKLALVEPAEMGNVDPRDVLAEELWRSRAAVIILGRLVNDLSLDEHGLYGKTYHQSGIATGEAKPHVLWVMWMAERAHLKAVAAEAARAKIETRRMELAESHAQQIASLLQAVFADPELGLKAKQRRTATVVAARHLRAVPDAA